MNNTLMNAAKLALLAAIGILTLVESVGVATGEKKVFQEETIMKSSNDKGLTCDFPNNEAELRKLLSPEQYAVTKENGTERPFRNAYWNNKEPGIYVDIISGEPLFSSLDKFDSGTGWPSFSKPLNPTGVLEKSDSSHGMVRTEVRSKRADSHLGHLFNDGPGPTGQRYCINSASLKFIPYSELEAAGYKEYLELFKGKETLPKAP